MAHFVGKTLHIRPLEILTTWGVPELIVAYGQYMNELADRNFKEYQAMKSKDDPPCPPRYAVRFISLREMEDG